MLRIIALNGESPSGLFDIIESRIGIEPRIGESPGWSAPNLGSAGMDWPLDGPVVLRVGELLAGAVKRHWVEVLLGKALQIQAINLLEKTVASQFVTLAVVRYVRA